MTSDAGALLLGPTDRAIWMIERFASCFHDERRPEWIELEVSTLVGQRVFGIALGYEDINDHDELRHDPMMAVLAGKLSAQHEGISRLFERERSSHKLQPYPGIEVDRASSGILTFDKPVTNMPTRNDFR